MKRLIAWTLILPLLLGSTTAELLAQRRRPSRGSVSSTGAHSRGTTTRSTSPGSATTTRQGQNASGSRTVSQTGEGFQVDKSVQTDSGASKSVSRDVNVEEREVDRSSTTTNRWGESVSRDREVERENGYLDIEGSAHTSTGREASFDGAAGRTVTGRPVVAGSVNTKYNGNYNVAAGRTPYGGWNTAVAGPYGGRVTRTLPSGYRTTTYHGRPYYAYGGAYYRPYMHHGVPFYYPVPVPYHAYYDTPPVGAIILLVAGISYLVAKDGTYSKQTTTSSGQVAYQAVPAPVGATLTTLPVHRVPVTVGGTTYFISANTFYRRTLENGQERFVTVTAPVGLVMVAALPAEFEVVELNTMYFKAGGAWFVPYLSPDGKELYVQVDPPPTPASPSTQSQSSPAPAASSAAAPAPTVRSVEERMTIPAGTVLVVRFASDISSKTATVNMHWQGFLDQDLVVGGRLVAGRGAHVYGTVTAVNTGSKMKGKASVTVALTDLQVGEQYVPVAAAPLTASGDASSGAKKLVGGVALGAAIGAIAHGGEGAAWGAAIGAGVGGAAAASGKVDAAEIPAQVAQTFTLSSPASVDVFTTVAVR